MKPPFAYYGGKARMAPWIVSLLPPHRVYVEPCLGGGSVFFAKPPTEHEVLNDVDGALVAFYRALRDHPAELIELCAATPYARSELESADLSEPGISDLEVARRWWVVVNQSYNRTGHASGFNASVAGGAGEAKATRRRLGRLHDVAGRLSDAVIECRPAVEVIERFDGMSTVHYIDPPYVAASRTNTTAAYRNEMTDADHRELAAVAARAKGTVLVSGYDSALGAELFDGWYRAEQRLPKRSNNRYGGAGDRTAVEVVWSNRPLDEGRLFGATS